MSIFFIFIRIQMNFRTRNLLTAPPWTTYRFQFPQILFHRFKPEITPDGRGNTISSWLNPSWCNNKQILERSTKPTRKKKAIIIPITLPIQTITIRIIIAIKSKQLLLLKLLLQLLPPPRNKSLLLSMSSSLIKILILNLLSFVHLKMWTHHLTIIMVLEALRPQVHPAPTNQLSSTEQWDGIERWVGSHELI